MTLGKKRERACSSPMSAARTASRAFAMLKLSLSPIRHASMSAMNWGEAA